MQTVSTSNTLYSYFTTFQKIRCCILAFSNSATRSTQVAIALLHILYRPLTFSLILGYQPVLNQITLKTLQGLVVLLVHVLLVVSRSERHKKHSLGI